MRFLVVEDNALNAELVRDLLEADGHDVDVVVDGASFRRHVAAGALADVVLLDVRLPDADGAQLLAELRARPAFVRAPIAAVTAHAVTVEHERLVAAGFDAVITKPIDTRTFVGRVKGLTWRGS